MCFQFVDLCSVGKELLRKLGEMIPNLKVRKEGKPKPPGWMDIMEPGAAGMMPAAAAAAVGSASGGGGNRQSSSKKKKKG